MEGKPWGLEARAVPSSAATQVTTGAHGGEKLCLDSQIHINPVPAAHVCKPSAPVVMWEAEPENAWKPVGQQPGRQNRKQGGKCEDQHPRLPSDLHIQAMAHAHAHTHAHLHPPTHTNTHACGEGSGEKETGGGLKGTKKKSLGVSGYTTHRTEQLRFLLLQDSGLTEDTSWPNAQTQSAIPGLWSLVWATC